MSLSSNFSVESCEINAHVTFWYGLRMRPCGGGAVPKSFNEQFNKEQALDLFPKLRDANNVRHGVINYSVELSNQEVKSFELVPLDQSMGIELEHLNTIPKSELEGKLVEVLALYFLENGDSWTTDEIRYDSEYELKNAFKKTTIFADRTKDMDTFKSFVECLKSLPYQAVISRLIDLRKLD
jgi:hypothetical protein